MAWYADAVMSISIMKVVCLWNKTHICKYVVLCIINILLVKQTLIQNNLIISEIYKNKFDTELSKLKHWFIFTFKTDE